MSGSFIEQLHYVRIPVKDVGSSARWYQEVLGLRLLDLTEQLAVMEVNGGPLLLALVPTADETYAHFTIAGQDAFIIGFTSPDLPGFHRHLLASGVEVDDMAEDQGHVFFHFYDPDGNKLQAHW